MTCFSEKRMILYSCTHTWFMISHNRTEHEMVSEESTKDIVYLCEAHDTTKIRPDTPNKSKSSVGIVSGVLASILVVGAIGFLLFQKWKSGKNSKQPTGHNNQNFQIE